jgi:hypothetical protein
MVVSGFLSTDVGRFVFLSDGYAKITGVGNTTNAVHYNYYSFR